MLKKNLSLFIYTSLILMFSTSALAQNPVSLTEALQAAIGHKLELKEASNTFFKAEFQLEDFQHEDFQWTATLPSLVLDESGLDVSNSWKLTGDKGKGVEYTLFLSKDLATFNFRRQLWPDPELPLAHQEDALKNSVISAENNLTNLQNQVLIETFAEYYDLQIAQANLEILEAKVASAHQEYQTYKRLLELAETTEAKLQQVQADYLRAQAALQKEQVSWNRELTLFFSSLGLSPQRGVEGLDLQALAEEAVLVLESSTRGDVTLEKVLEANEEIRNLRFQVKLKEQALEIARADSPWTVSISAGPTANLNTHETTWEGTLGATLDLSGNKDRAHSEDLALRELELARQRLTEAKVQVQEDFYQKQADLAYQKALLQAAYLDWQSAQANYQTAEVQYREGLITATQLTSSEISRNNAFLTLAKTYVDYRVQELELHSLAGGKPLFQKIKGETDLAH